MFDHVAFEVSDDSEYFFSLNRYLFLAKKQ